MPRLFQSVRLPLTLSMHEHCDSINWKKSKAEIFPRLCLICGHLFNNYLVLDSGVETVIKRSHAPEGQQLDVKPYYPFLEN